MSKPLKRIPDEWGMALDLCDKLCECLADVMSQVDSSIVNRTSLAEGFALLQKNNERKAL